MAGLPDRRIDRVAALYDIHGNLPALAAVLADVRRERVDLIVVGGDVLPGPMPQETMARLLALDTPVQFIHGNGDRVVLAQLTGGSIDEVPEPYRESIRWTAGRLDPECQRALASWPPTVSIEVAGLGDVLFCHATPQNDRNCFTRVTPEDRVRRLFAGVTAPVAVCGHTHLQFDRTVGTLRIVNAGSIGAPFAPPAGAHWLLLGPDVQLRHTTYDLGSAAASMRATGYPLVEETAVRYVLRPPPEAEMLAVYARADV
jgi:diadenosine tetraphosphatase ApaH/serine/threonine PP2A family protein phosphatase